MNLPLAQVNPAPGGGITQDMLDRASETVSKLAHEPMEWWMAGLTIGSLVCIYMVVKKMLASQREGNLTLLNMVKEKDLQLKAMSEKMISILEDRWKSR